MYAPVKSAQTSSHIPHASTSWTMRRNLLAVVLAGSIGVPTGWIGSMLLTPILWRLEPILHMELAGHSGPADWVFYVVWGIVISGLFLIFRFMILSRDRKLPRS
jgi:hypothetical protein